MRDVALLSYAPTARSNSRALLSRPPRVSDTSMAFAERSALLLDARPGRTTGRRGAPGLWKAGALSPGARGAAGFRAPDPQIRRERAVECPPGRRARTVRSSAGKPSGRRSAGMRP